MNSPWRQRVGRLGEDLAARHLEQRGYRILERGYRCKTGEIDIVAEDGEVLVFVEVRLKAGEEFGDPLASITPAKQRQVRRAAAWYLIEHEAGNRPCRFDAVGIEPAGAGRGWKIELIRDAFE